MLANMKIGTKLFVGFSLMVLLLLTVGGAGWYGLYQMGVTLTRIERASSVLKLATEAEIAVLQAANESLLYTANADDNAYKRVADANNTIRETAKKITDITLRDEMRDLARQIGPLADQFDAVNEELHGCIGDRTVAEERRRAAGSLVTKAFENLQGYFEDVNKPEGEHCENTQQHLLWF